MGDREEGRNAVSGRNDGTQAEERKDIVCLNKKRCAGIILGEISNLYQAASPVLTDAPVSVSTPTPNPTLNSEHLIRPFLSQNERGGAQSGPARRSAGKACERASTSVKSEAVTGPAVADHLC